MVITKWSFRRIWKKTSHRSWFSFPYCKMWGRKIRKRLLGTFLLYSFSLRVANDLQVKVVAPTYLAAAPSRGTQLQIQRLLSSLYVWKNYQKFFFYFLYENVQTSWKFQLLKWFHVFEYFCCFSRLYSPMLPTVFLAILDFHFLEQSVTFILMHFNRSE